MPNFVKGLYAKAAHPNAPDFVKCRLSIKIADLQEWLSSQQSEWANIDVKVSKEGNWYCEQDMWTPDKSKAKETPPEPKSDFVDSEIPF